MDNLIGLFSIFPKPIREISRSTGITLNAKVLTSWCETIILMQQMISVLHLETFKMLPGCSTM